MKAKKTLLFLASLLLTLSFGGYAVVQSYVKTAEMAVMVIEVTDGAAFVETEYLDATITIDYPNLWQDATFCVSIRQRGNNTMLFEKKPYKIKLDEKADLLLGGSTLSDNAARDWVLLADYFDRSNLRNYFTFLTAAEFESFSFVPEGIFTEVYFKELDGTLTYQGVYLLCQQVEVDEARVDIDDTVDTEKGFLVELVTRESLLKQDYSVDFVGANGDVYFDIRSQIDNEQDITRIYDILFAADTAIASGDQEAVAAIIDLDSCVDMYIIQEYMKNLDAGWASFYLYCEAGESLLYFCPPWDFDHSSGMDWRLDEGGYEGLYVGDVTNVSIQRNEWYQMLIQYDWFQDLVKERWNEKKNVFLDGLTKIQSIATDYDAQFQSNYDLWRTETQNTDNMAYTGDSYQDDAQYLFDWLENRYVWLDDYFNNAM